MNQREAFEQAWRKRYGSGTYKPKLPHDKDGNYCAAYVQIGWEMWQDAQAAAFPVILNVEKRGNQFPSE